MNNIEIARFNMIEQQIRPWEVLDHQVLSTLQQVNREDFVDPAYRGLAYADCQIPIANGVRMLPPTIEGRMLQALLLDKDDDVLTIGCANGYIIACIARLAGKVNPTKGGTVTGRERLKARTLGSHAARTGSAN